MSQPPHPLRDLPGLLLVFLGGTAGTTARLVLELWVPAESGRWPITTFAINLSGAFILAALLTYIADSRLDAESARRLRLFGGTGICGGFTTYSAFADEQIRLIVDGHAPLALAYGGATLILGAVATAGGLVVGARLAGGAAR